METQDRDLRPKPYRGGNPRRARRRGATAVIAMLFLVLMTTLAAAMYPMATLNSRGAANFADNTRAHAAAESGLRWMAWRFVHMSRPKTTVGSITPAVAANMWPTILDTIKADLGAVRFVDNGNKTTPSGNGILTAPISTGQGTFQVKINQHPLYAGDPLDQRYIRVTSIGAYGSGDSKSVKSVSMDFRIDKKVKFAIVGKVPIQIGRNTIVEGPIAMTAPNKFPPILQLSDFRHLTTSLKTKIDAFNNFLETNHKGYDNRINIHNPDEYAKAAQAGYSDYNGDSFIDEYDLFLKEFDKNGDKAITTAEFTNPSTGKLYDPDLFKAIDALGGPLYDGDEVRTGYQDGKIDNGDAYAKVRGEISIAATAKEWSDNLAPSRQTINDNLQGPIQTSDGSIDPAVRFGVEQAEVFDLSPSNFDTSGFRAKSGPENGTTKTATVGGQVVIENKVLAVTDASLGPPTVQVTTTGSTKFKAGDLVLKSDFDAANAPLSASKRATAALPVNTAKERTPIGSTTYQATYQRPVFKNMKFKNVRIPKGMNAVFDNCTFEGVTFVELTTNITNSAGQTTTNPNDARTWSQKMKSGSFTADTVLTTGNSYGYERGNNLRFNNCTMNGPIASDVPTAYSHFTNSMEFTGSTLFDNQFDQTATMVLPQTNIEMGSFTDPAKAPSTLTGVVVAGNLDIRGTSMVDGSIIITGDGAGNTTQGWFGPSDADTDATTPMPEGGYGRLNIRYNPFRALPDGINIAIDILPDTNTYTEGQ